ncbi:MAG: DNRLRE domain-containing protein [Acidobacteria bacterium]|nr:DNRLRE domain-containing protein [Acidobacteriota bacterium]
MKNRSLSLVAVVLFIWSATISTYAQITPSADSYTNTATPTTNFGAKTTLSVVSPSQAAYIQFDLSSIPSGFTGASVAKATLKLYVNTVPAAGSFNVDFINGTWSEKTITANLVPALGSTIVPSVPLTGANAKDYILIDVTPAVVAWLNNTQANDGIALVANSPLSATFESKENTAQGHSPELDVVFSGGSGGTITGINTAAGSGLTGGTNSGVANLSLLTSCSSGQILSWNGSAWVCKSVSGSGTVTSVGLSAPSSDFTVSGSPVTTSGTLGLNWTVAPTSANAANTIVKRDASGAFNAGIIHATTTSTTSAVNGTSSSTSLGAIAIHGVDTNSANTFTVAVQGNSFSPIGAGVLGMKASMSSMGQSSIGNVNPGVWGDSPTDNGVLGTSDVFAGVAGMSTNYIGVTGQSQSGTGVGGYSTNAGSVGVLGFSKEGNALWGYNQPEGGAADTNSTLLLINDSSTSHYMIYAEDILGAHYVRTSSVGDLVATGALIGASKSFKIDHPVDPTNKFLLHTSIESPDMKNIYDGVAVLDENGEARVDLPSYFEALNKDFRYQLTAVGAPGPNLYVAEEVLGNHFRIAGGKPGAKVSWQITGIRHDAWANANRSPVEVEKTASERGLYLHPEAFGAPVEKSITYHNRAAVKQFVQDPRKVLRKTPVEQSAKR